MERSGKVPSQVYILGILALLMISSVSILHTNEYEFVWLRFEGLTLFQLSLFDTVLYSAYLLFGLLTGVLSDRLGRRRAFVIAGSASAAILFTLMTRISTYSLLLILRFLQGACSVMGWQILMTLVLDHADNSNRGRCMGVFGGFLALSMGMGPVVGGILASRSVLLPYYTSTALNLLAFFMAMVLLREPSHLRKKESLAESFTILKGRPGLTVTALFNFVDRLHIGFIIFLLPLFMELTLGKGPDLRGLILGIHALPFILLQYPVGQWSDRVGRLQILVPGTIGYGVLLSLSGYIGAQGAGTTAVMFFLLGICSGLTGPTNGALVGDLVERDENAVAMALFNLAGNLGIIAGPLIAGWVLDRWNPVSSFLVGGLIEIAALLMSLPLLKRQGLLKGMLTLRSKSSKSVR